MIRRRSVVAQTPTTAFFAPAPGHRLAVARDLRLGHLQHERVRVVARDVVLAAALVAEADVRPARLVDVDAVEDRAEVDEERVVDRADERLAAARHAGDRPGRDLAVVRVGLRAGVGRRDRHVVRDPPRPHLLAVVRLAVEVVGLDEVEVRIADRVDGRGRVQERLRVAEALVELPAVGHVRAPVAGVVDLHVVARLGIELAEVRPAGRLLQRDPVGDDREAAGGVRRGERVDVGVVGRGVGEDLRGLAMARAGGEPDRQRPGGERGRRGRAQDGGSAHERSSGWGRSCLRFSGANGYNFPCKSPCSATRSQVRVGLRNANLDGGVGRRPG